jgi:hypothetical protein
MNSESNSKSRLKTTKGKFIVLTDSKLKGCNAGLFHSYLTRLRMNSESNSKSRLKTTKGKFIVLTDLSY